MDISPEKRHYAYEREFYILTIDAKERKLYVQVYHHRHGITQRKENGMYMYITIKRALYIEKRILQTCILI